ncbi:calcium/sodium antiporter [Terribacillus saccharophilus]|uniref:Sodium:proton exchanger n=1 Tax=Terribacillus saccharophilus TaxID=361277 RepID=A0ABX4GUJ5_9BACI|nr:calcium/sodium antiporter [Terribacillus saccharophilus]PAD34219.1 sodium:proton exchanger [Terribacillus saccharophilus]PAD94796.1 sodium:proton exchanger [Terribacillus saccharophilus]PAD98545.1 sodium:proton exchanger [Terribacillus saccharophilus]
MTYVLLIIGFVLLIKGADYFVEGSSKIAAALKISPLLIGLTIVAMGTSAPEATVSIVAALDGSAGVAVGNVVGSNIFNITFVVGLAAVIFPLTVGSETIRKEIPFTLLASVALLILISDISLQQMDGNYLTRSDGFILLLFFAIFLYYIFEVARKDRKNTQNTKNTTNGKPKWGKNTLLTVGGLAAIIFGGELVVNNATEIAISFGMSETLVGLTIVAIGTSLPELITSVTAAIKKENEIALGNIIGSNIFNIFFVLGLASSISPFAIEGTIVIDILLLIVITLVLLVFSRTNYKVGKMEGGLLAVIYIVYMVYIIIRN